MPQERKQALPRRELEVGQLGGEELDGKLDDTLQQGESEFMKPAGDEANEEDSYIEKKMVAAVECKIYNSFKGTPPPSARSLTRSGMIGVEIEM